MQPKLMITRPQPAGRAFAAEVSAKLRHPVPIIFAPAFQIVPLAVTMPPFEQLVLTSANGVAQAQRLGVPKETIVWCVGDKTAAIARKAGFQARSATGTADDLIALIVRAGIDAVLVHLTGRHTRGDVSARLEKNGISCREVAAYDQQVLPLPAEVLRAFQQDAPIVAPLFSPRSALPLLDTIRKAPLHVVAISAAVADAVSDRADTVQIADRPDADAMRDATCAVLRCFIEKPR